MKRLSWVAVIIIVLLAISTGYVIYHPDSKPKAPYVELTGGNRKHIDICIEIVDDPKSRELGLMNRKSLDKDSGMLFIFENSGCHPFWMKNTLIQLDMIFISGDMTIVDINRNAVPMSLTPFYPKGDSVYVLEVNGGLCDEYDINIGDKVIIELGET